MSFNATYTRNTFDNYGYPDIGRDSQELVLEWTNSITFSNWDRLTVGTLFNHVEGQETYFGIDSADPDFRWFASGRGILRPVGPSTGRHRETGGRLPGE